jgi:hypothetical protein
VIAAVPLEVMLELAGSGVMVEAGFFRLACPGSRPGKSAMAIPANPGIVLVTLAVIQKRRLLGKRMFRPAMLSVFLASPRAVV